MGRVPKAELPPGEEERYREFIARQQRLQREKLAREAAKPKIKTHSSPTATARILKRKRRLRFIRVAEAVGVCLMSLLLGVLYWQFRPERRALEQDPAQIQWAKGEGLGLEVVNSIGMRFRLIPSGSFLMGSSKDEPGHRPDEVSHKRRIPYSFYMAVTETTQAQYEEVMEQNPSFFEGRPDMPVDSVLWHETLAFCNELSRREGLNLVYEKRESGWVCHVERNGYRLPTEAEWEYACRAGTTSPLYSGSLQPLSRKKTNLRRIAWFHRNARGHSHAVGQLAPNAWGLHDTSGNVREWCWDKYALYPVTRQPSLLGSESGIDRIVRGGGWYAEPDRCRSASRRRWGPFERWKSVGFRCVRTAEKPTAREM